MWSRLNAGRTALRSELALPASRAPRSSGIRGALDSAPPTLLASYYVRQNVEAEARPVRGDHPGDKDGHLPSCEPNLDAMFGARGLFLGSDPVEHEQWDAYVKSTDRRPVSRGSSLWALRST